MKAKKIIVLDGPEGVGKSTMAREVYKQVSRLGKTKLIHFPTDLSFLELPTINEQIDRLKRDFQIHLKELIDDGFEYIVCDRAFLSTACYQTDSNSDPNYDVLGWGIKEFKKYCDELFFILPCVASEEQVLKNLRSRDVNDPDIKKFNHSGLIKKYEKAGRWLVKNDQVVYYVHGWGASDMEDYVYLLNGAIKNVCS